MKLKILMLSVILGSSLAYSSPTYTKEQDGSITKKETIDTEALKAGLKEIINTLKFRIQQGQERIAEEQNQLQVLEADLQALEDAEK